MIVFRWKRMALAGLFALALLLGTSQPRDAAAQVPPHYPGTICFTLQFWCWAAQPGPPGSPCVCPSPYGWVPGYFG